MFIRGIGVELHHATDELPEDSPLPKVCIPRDCVVWGDILRHAIGNHGYLQLSLATAPARRTAVIVLGVPEDIEDPLAALNSGGSFGFLADLATLRGLRGVIDAAIAAVAEA